MDCELSLTDELQRNLLEDLTIIKQYTCPHCKNSLNSKYPPAKVHRQCKSMPESLVKQRPGGIISRLSRWQKAIARWKTAGQPVRSDATVLEILETKCQPCEHFKTNYALAFLGLPSGSCKLCECKLNLLKNGRANKIRMATESCPDDPPRWAATVTVEDE